MPEATDEGTVAVRDVELRWEVGGDGPGVLYVSGTGSDLRARDLIRPALRRHLRVLTYDHRNLGRSTIRDEPTTMAEYAADAAALIERLAPEQLGTTPPIPVVGISFGGMVAQELAVTSPHLVSRLALACTSPGGGGGRSYPLHELEPLADPEAAAVRSLELGDTRLDAAWRERNPDRAAAVIGDLVARRTLGDGEPLRAEGARRQLEARAGHDVWDRLPGLAMPVLVQGGRFDGIARPDVVEGLAGRIPGAELRMYDGGHLFLATSSDARDDLVAFLAA